jgi:hypothetical protein
MHGLSLGSIRARVERLAVASGFGCDGTHQLMHVSDVPWGDPVPVWPPADAATRCICGAELEYRHIVHMHILDAPVAE